jgi:epsin
MLGAALDKVNRMVGTDLEKKVKEATSDENWGAPSSLMAEIARATHDYEGYKEVMNMLWKRLTADSKQWRVVFKSEVLVEYLLRNGSERAVQEIRDRISLVRGLQDFRSIDEENGKDHGQGVRDKAKQILDLLHDEDRLNEARETARKNANKFKGISSSGVEYGTSGGSGTGPYDHDARDWRDTRDSRDRGGSDRRQSNRSYDPQAGDPGSGRGAGSGASAASHKKKPSAAPAEEDVAPPSGNEADEDKPKKKPTKPKEGAKSSAGAGEGAAKPKAAAGGAKKKPAAGAKKAASAGKAAPSAGADEEFDDAAFEAAFDDDKPAPAGKKKQPSVEFGDFEAAAVAAPAAGAAARAAPRGGAAAPSTDYFAALGGVSAQPQPAAHARPAPAALNLMDDFQPAPSGAASDFDFVGAGGSSGAKPAAAPAAAAAASAKPAKKDDIDDLANLDKLTLGESGKRDDAAAKPATGKAVNMGAKRSAPGGGAFPGMMGSAYPQPPMGGAPMPMGGMPMGGMPMGGMPMGGMPMGGMPMGGMPMGGMPYYGAQGYPQPGYPPMGGGPAGGWGM